MFKLYLRSLNPVIFICFISLPHIAEAFAQSIPQQYIEGIVCGDLNSNGECDTDEPGIAGVMVSNQRDVVLTDEGGHYKLPIEEEMIVFVTKPAEYDLPLDENNLPQFYYIHHPEGSLELQFPGIEPTGPLPSSTDFALIPSGKKDSFTAVVLSDPTLRERTIPFYRDAIVSELTNVEADLTMVLGDIMADDLSFFPRYNKIMRTLNMPVFNIVGNHDVNFNIENRYAKETYKRFFGPNYFSFNYGDVHFIALDNIEMMDDDGSPYRGFLNETHLTWLKNNLQYVSEDKLIVFLAHIPLYSMDTDARSNNTVNRNELLALLDDRDRVLFLSGHRHMTFHHFLSEEFGRTNLNPVHHIATTATAGGWWRGPENKHGIPVSTQNDGTPNGYYIFQFEGNSYIEHYKAAGFGSDYQMRIESPESNLTHEEWSESELVVNVFNGNEKSRVRFRINDSDEWYEMERQEEYHSPFIVRSEWVNPMITNHIWKSDLPVMEKGAHSITVWTRDMYGGKFTQTKVIEID